MPLLKALNNAQGASQASQNLFVVNLVRCYDEAARRSRCQARDLIVNNTVSHCPLNWSTGSSWETFAKSKLDG